MQGPLSPHSRLVSWHVVHSYCVFIFCLDLYSAASSINKRIMAFILFCVTVFNCYICSKRAARSVDCRSSRRLCAVKTFGLSFVRFLSEKKHHWCSDIWIVENVGAKTALSSPSETTPFLLSDASLPHVGVTAKRWNNEIIVRWCK